MKSPTANWLFLLVIKYYFQILQEIYKVQHVGTHSQELLDADNLQDLSSLKIQDGKEKSMQAKWNQ